MRFRRNKMCIVYYATKLLLKLCTWTCPGCNLDRQSAECRVQGAGSTALTRYPGLSATNVATDCLATTGHVTWNNVVSVAVWTRNV